MEAQVMEMQGQMKLMQHEIGKKMKEIETLKKSKNTGDEQPDGRWWCGWTDGKGGGWKGEDHSGKEGNRWANDDCK